jgi:hypothetical protein
LDLVRFRLVPAEPVVVEEEELEELEALGDETLSPPLRRALDIFAGGGGMRLVLFFGFFCLVNDRGQAGESSIS